MFRFCLLLVFLHTPTISLAWGMQGHRITGYIAMSLLTPTARTQLLSLMGNTDLATAATYMDQQRTALTQQWPASPSWHFDNRPVCTTQPSPYCSNKNCATEQTLHFKTLLADATANQQQRITALRVLIHLLGDLHQPLHMADHHDHGGNDIIVQLNGERFSLHHFLDTVLIKNAIGQQRLRNYARTLKHRYAAQISTWQQGDISQWATETHQLAVQEVYGLLPNFSCSGYSNEIDALPPLFLDHAAHYVPQQLTKAGARIAYTLNQIFTDAHTTHH